MIKPSLLAIAIFLVAIEGSSPVTSVTMEQEGTAEARQFILRNHSAKDVYYVEVLTSKTAVRVTSVGFITHGKLTAGQSMPLDARNFSGDKELAIRTVVFEDDTYEGEERTARQQIIRRHTLRDITQQFIPRIKKLATEEKPKELFIAIKVEINHRIEEYGDLNHLPPARNLEELSVRYRLSAERNAMEKVLRELDQIEPFISSNDKEGLIRSVELAVKTLEGPY